MLHLWILKIIGSGQIKRQMAVAQMNIVYYMELRKLPEVLDFQIISAVKKYGSQNAVRRGERMLSK